jgi:hypothetical protein
MPLCDGRQAGFCTTSAICCTLPSICGISDEQLALIAGKMRQAPCIVNTYWHRLG